MTCYGDNLRLYHDGCGGAVELSGEVPMWYPSARDQAWRCRKCGGVTRRVVGTKSEALK